MLGRIRSRFKRLLTQDWPKPKVDLSFEPEFCILLTPPNSGSTAIADFVCQLDSVTGIEERYEGQWLIRMLSRKRDRWDPEKDVNYDSVRAVWLAAFSKALIEKPTARYVLEKSPPNMVRHHALKRIFPSARFAVNNRDPYANIASRARRYGGERQDDPVERPKLLAELAASWLTESDYLYRAVVEDGYPLLSYEAFCENPTAAFNLFGLAEEEGKIATDYAVRVKDYEAQGIQNMNGKQIAELSDDDIAVVSKELIKKKDLLDFFGYELR